MKKMLVLSIALLLVIMANKSFAGFEIKTSAKGGATFNWLMPGFSSTFEKNSNDLAIGPYITGTGGLFVEFAYLFEGIFIYGVGLEIGVVYTGRGVQQQDTIKTEGHYIGVPVMLKVSGPFIKYLWTGVGVSYNRLLAHKTPPPIGTVINKDLVELIYGLGFYIPITSVVQIVGEVRGYFGLTHYEKVPTTNTITGLGPRTIGFDVMLGIAFKVY